ncbi:hypothetical protein HB364_17135 [Pseudoflavitalea sp. X16]|uniref:hypothetical protein n=1 Tax=Paraflavitalea devenefica TaxID=2716334 RepID=UPI001421E1C4|nr:hypothetical protein [Paraflavitalea devenefica]NII26817.1 hypothetical protein [Paraflavitalea devenefica]
MDKPKPQNSKKKKEKNNKLLHLSLGLYATFYPKYYLLETTLKNRLYYLVKQRLGESWFDDQLNSSKNDTVFKLEADVILRRKPKGFVLKDKGLLVESGLGIWVEFFNRNLYKELKGVPILIFPKLPPDIKRKELYKQLSKVKELRNQLFHYRIPPATKSTDVNILIDVNNDLMNLLQWLDVPTGSLASKEFEKKIEAVRKALD